MSKSNAAEEKPLRLFNLPVPIFLIITGVVPSWTGTSPP